MMVIIIITLYLSRVSCVVTCVAFFPSFLHPLEESCPVLYFLPISCFIMFSIEELNKSTSFIHERGGPLPTLIFFPGIAPIFQCLSCPETPKLDTVILPIQSQVGQIWRNLHFPWTDYVVAYAAQGDCHHFDPRTHYWPCSTCQDSSVFSAEIILQKNYAQFIPSWPSASAVVWCLSVWCKRGEKKLQQWMFQYLFSFLYHLQFEKLKSVHLCTMAPITTAYLFTCIFFPALL